MRGTIKKCLGCGLHYQMPSSASRCEPCRARHKKAARETPDAINKTTARLATKKALIQGIIVPSACQVCGDKRSEAHHVDYDDPLNVQWLCRRHHQQLHHDLRFRARLEQGGRWSAEEIQKIMERRTGRGAA